jgi:hypothetical protein
VRIIVPACARCNRERGCRDLIPFLLTRPQRISCLLDYLAMLSWSSLREVDLRIFAEVYAAVTMLHEASSMTQHGPVEQQILGGRSLHRRRYAARRAMLVAGNRVQALRDRTGVEEGPTCLIPSPRADILPIFLEEPIERLESRILSLLALLWGVSGEVVAREMHRAVSGTAADREPCFELDQWDEAGGTDTGVGGDQVGRRRRRHRVDRRRGGPARTHRPSANGRAA